MKLSIIPPDGDGPHDGARYQILVDDQPIFPLDLQLDMNPGGVPTVTLDVALHTIGRFDLEDPRITVPDVTRDLLIRLGWTPPETPRRTPCRSTALRPA